MAEQLRHAGVRVNVDDRNEKMGYKIREAQVQKVPYMLVVGDKEVEAGNASRPPPPGAATWVPRRVDELAATRSPGWPRERAILEEAPAPPPAGGVS